MNCRTAPRPELQRLTRRVLLVGDLCYLHTRRWAAGLAGCGVNVTVLSPTPAVLNGVRVVSGAVPPWRPWRPQRWLARWRSVFRRSLADAQFDLVHVHYPHPYCVFLDELEGHPLIVSTWGSEVLPMDAEPEAHKTLKVAYLQHARRVVALSNFLAEATATYAGLDRRRVVTHYWGIDNGQFTPPGVPCEDPVIGFAKALSKQYGAEYLIDALPLIRRNVPGARLLMLGEGDLAPALRARAERLGVAAAIEWAGAVDHSLMPRYYARMAVSVMPSVYPSETLGLSALESQAMGVPVVASRLGGIPEAVIDGETGLLVPPRDPHALADALVRLLKDADFRRTLGRHGVSHVARRFDWRSTLRSTIELYDDVMASGHALSG